jgi:hypothetical protein
VVFSQERIQKAFSEAVTYLQKRRLPYLIVGGIAVSVWGRGRATADVDLQLHVPSLDNAARQFPENWKEDKKWLIYNPQLRDIQKRFVISRIVVDFMLPRDEFEQGILRRRVRKKVWGKIVFVASPEDLVLMKMKAGRPRDFDDAVGIVVLNSGLDRDFIRNWALKLNLRDEYSYLFRVR